MGPFGPTEIIIILVIALVVFGPKRLPEMGKSLGKGIREFKSSVTGDDEHEEQAARARELPPAAPAPVSYAAPPAPAAYVPPAAPPAATPVARPASQGESGGGAYR
jgi:sec-independent protein translocase protein TatA